MSTLAFSRSLLNLLTNDLGALVDKGHEHPYNEDHGDEDSPKKHFHFIAKVHKLAHDIARLYNRQYYEEKGFRGSVWHCEGDYEFHHSNQQEYEGYSPQLFYFRRIRRENNNFRFFMCHAQDDLNEVKESKDKYPNKIHEVPV